MITTSASAPDGGEEMSQLMTDADFERALDALHVDSIDADVGDLLRAMNENRIISWEEAERILCDASNEPVKSSLPPQTRPTEPDNDTDVDSSIRRLLQNDPKLVEINLNNMKRTPIPQIKRILEALRENTFLEKISLANMGLYDMDVAPLIKVIEDNETLRAVNVETNYLSGEFFARLLRATLKNQTLEEIKAVNQGVSFSTAAEREIINAVFENRSLTKVSLNLRLPEGRHKIEQATIRNQEIRRILRRQTAEAARAAVAAEAAKAAAIATRMIDISPGKILTTGKPPTKKQQETMAAAATAAAANHPNALALVGHSPRNIDTPHPSLAAEKPTPLRLNHPIDVHDAADVPPAVAPAIFGQCNQSGERAERTIVSLTDHQRDGHAMDSDKNGWRPPGSPTKVKPMVRKLSNDLESIYAKKDGNEAKIAYIPEAPVGRASLIAKKFEKKEASARRDAERSARRWPTAKRLTENRFHVPAIVLESLGEPTAMKALELKTDTVGSQSTGVLKRRQQRDEVDAETIQTKPDKPDLSDKCKGEMHNKTELQLSKKDSGDTLTREPIAKEVKPARSDPAERNGSRLSDRHDEYTEKPLKSPGRWPLKKSETSVGGSEALWSDVYKTNEESDHTGSRCRDFQHRRRFNKVDEDQKSLSHGKNKSKETIEIPEKTTGLNGKDSSSEIITSASRREKIIGKKSERKFAQDIMPNNNASHEYQIPMEPEKKPLTTRPKRIYGDLKRQIDPKPDPLPSNLSKSNGAKSLTMLRKDDHRSDTVKYGASDRELNPSPRSFSTRNSTRDSDPLTTRAFYRSDTQPNDRSSTSTANEPNDGSTLLRRYRAFNSVDADSTLPNSQYLTRKQSNLGDFDTEHQDSNGASHSIASSEYVPLSTRQLHRQPPVPSPKPMRRF